MQKADQKLKLRIKMIPLSARKFTLKEKCFSSGKMLSPSREFWATCSCCGKPIVQGYIMGNGHKVGNDCYEVIDRAVNNVTFGRSNVSLYKMFGTPKKVQEYILENIK